MPPGYIERIRLLISGKKTYLLAVAAIIGTAVTWSEGAITDIQAIVALYVALQSCFIRAGIAKIPAIASASAVQAAGAIEDVEESEAAYTAEAKAHARVMEAQAEALELQNGVNQKRLEAVYKQAEIKQVVDVEIARREGEKASEPHPNEN